MALKQPESMDECVYFTQRSLEGGKGSVKVWVFRQTCPKCRKAVMGKPRGSNGKVKTRAEEYACPSCGNVVEKQAYEDSLTANAEYQCPACGSSGEAQVPFKRKNIEGIPTLRFQCGKCKANIDVTKKLKEKKRKGSSADVADDPGV
ncbi:MAG TPA: hypothetical protein VI934_02540 [Candidatus Nanoarchaeia archaeon]|nr:hypothetical protein [Candidatus Nanoarchaeia archaeon]